MFMAVMSVATQLNKSMILISSKYIYANLRNKVDLDAPFLYFCTQKFGKALHGMANYICLLGSGIGV